MGMSEFLAAKYAALTPYTPGEQPKGQRLVKLNTNELPYPPPPAVQTAAANAAAGFNLYSDPTCAPAVQALAAQYKVAPQQVFCGNGSDEILALCFAAFCQNGAAFADVTYGFYPVWASLFGVDAILVPLRDDFTLHPDDYAGLGRTIFIANPNAPTGIALPRQGIRQMLLQNPNSLVVVDEAYVDFGAESAVPLVEEHKNLLVVGTFSKSRAMAGARFGYTIANPALIEDLNLLKFSFNPYNVNSATLAAAAAALQNQSYFNDCRDKIIITRQRTLQTLQAMGFSVTQSLANFVFASHKTLPAQALYAALRQKGVLVRWWGLPRIQNHLRISIGTNEQMDELFAALEEILRQPHSPAN